MAHSFGTPTIDSTVHKLHIAYIEDITLTGPCTLNSYEGVPSTSIRCTWLTNTAVTRYRIHQIVIGTPIPWCIVHVYNRMLYQVPRSFCVCMLKEERGAMYSHLFGTSSGTQSTLTPRIKVSHIHAYRTEIGQGSCPPIHVSCEYLR